ILTWEFRLWSIKSARNGAHKVRIPIPNQAHLMLRNKKIILCLSRYLAVMIMPYSCESRQVSEIKKVTVLFGCFRDKVGAKFSVKFPFRGITQGRTSLDINARGRGAQIALRSGMNRIAFSAGLLFALLVCPSFAEPFRSATYLETNGAFQVIA